MEVPPPAQTTATAGSTMPFMASLNLPDLGKLFNEPIAHDATWPAMPAKLPLDILKFEGKP